MLGMRIVITIMEHHSNMLPWQMVARQTGAKLVYLECEKDGSLPDEKLEAVIGPKVKLAAIGHVSNVLGCVNPVEKVIELVHRNGRCCAGRCRPECPPHESGCADAGC